MTDRPQWAPAEVDLDRASVARVYDYYLGGSHNFASDRAFAQKVLDVYPQVTTLARDNRAFLRRAVRHLCDVGVDQFLDLGSGIPTEGNVHEIARAANPATRVVYVDRDPVAVVHSNHILGGDDRATAVLADVRDAEQVIDLAVRSGLDLGRPVGVLAAFLLQFIADADGPADLLGRYLAVTASGSHLVLSQPTRAGEAIMRGADVYDRADSPNTAHLRTPAELTAFFAGLDLVPPGVVPLRRWRPELGEEQVAGDVDAAHGGVGRKP